MASSSSSISDSSWDSTYVTNSVGMLKRRFEELFGGSPRIFRAPGRVNLIGEHTDYNDGFVMPAAIHLSTWVAIAPRLDRKLVIHSENFSETVELSDGARDGWSRYVLGIARVLERMGQ